MHCRIFPVISLKSVLKMVASVTVVIGTLSLGACSSSKQASKTATHRPSKPASVKDIDIASMTKTEKSLVKEATAWLGTPTSMVGIHAAALIAQVSCIMCFSMLSTSNCRVIHASNMSFAARFQRKIWLQATWSFLPLREGARKCRM